MNFKIYLLGLFMFLIALTGNAQVITSCNNVQTTCDNPAVISSLHELKDGAGSVVSTVTFNGSVVTATPALPAGITYIVDANGLPEVSVDLELITSDYDWCFVNYETSCGVATINSCVSYAQAMSGAVQPTDSDGDGVPDSSDACPNTSGNQSNGCNDADNDGVTSDTDPDDSDPCVPNACATCAGNTGSCSTLSTTIRTTSSEITGGNYTPLNRCGNNIYIGGNGSNVTFNIPNGTQYLEVDYTALGFTGNTSSGNMDYLEVRINGSMFILTNSNTTITNYDCGVDVGGGQITDGSNNINAPNGVIEPTLNSTSGYASITIPNSVGCANTVEIINRFTGSGASGSVVGLRYCQ